ncbi:imelysin family protein [Flavobacterium antarcticum]|uniref:imelysin family protein n=1 Tax=Flavobacterium antarcticum TaxID=271155 RepID=UPI0003B30097|nr:imelysin family protein [Flavobacterium antarcticum]
MKRLYFKVSFILAGTFLIVSCSNDDNSVTNENVTKKEVIENYADIAYNNYKKAYDDAAVLENSITTFTSNPTDANFTFAKKKWKEARESYGTTEAFRFANGPIDDENGPEALMNAWPLDENFVDYVVGNLDAGIINATNTYPIISKELLTDLNENGGEKNISVGYHAIEFLLWGQDLTDPADNLPGQRPYTDYLVNGTAENQARRATYLNVCADLLTDHLQYMVNQWKPGGAYRTIFLALPENTALKNMYLGITTLVLAELPIERMNVALGNADQEDEHSCFSDYTHRDIYLNLKGVVNVYQGTYGSINGPSLADLVENADATIFNATATAETQALAKVAQILTPFDLAIAGGPSTAEGLKVQAAVLQLDDYGSNLLAGAAKIGILVNN